MITYGSTTLTSYNTITNIEVYYYKSTSATSLSGGSWSTTKPTWENGKYIWQKIRTTYEGKLENGLYYSESDPVNITGQQGATGTAAYSYKLNASDTIITKSEKGEYSVSKITFTSTSKQGTNNVNAYAGRFKIETTANGTTWTTRYPTSGTGVDESSKEYTIPTDIIAIRCSLYQSGGFSTLLDIMTIPIINDGVGMIDPPYKEVEWVESTGKQYVYLDWKPPIKTWGFEVDFISRNAVSTTMGAWDESTNKNGYGTIFGVRNSSGVNNAQLSSYNNGLLRIGNSTAITTAFKTDHSRQTIKLHGTTITRANGVTATVTRVDETTGKPYCNMAVFGLYEGLRRTSTGNITEPSSTRIYSLKFYDGDTLAVDLVGSIRKADGITGLYDKVSKHFYPAPGMLFGNEVGDITNVDTVADSLNKADVSTTVVNKNRTRMWETSVPFNRLEDGQKITVTYSYGNVVSSTQTSELVGWDDTSSNSNVYLRLTYPDGTKSEWIPCYYSQTARLTTHYGAGIAIIFTYRENLLSNATETTGGYAIVRGFFANASYYQNTSYTQYSNNVKAGTNGIKGYTLIMKDSEDTWSCFYSGAYKTTNTGKPAYTGGFMLGKILYSAGAGAQTSNSSLDTYYNYKSGVNTSTIYDAYPVDLRYSTNCASTLISQRPVYIVGTVENDGLFHLDVSQWYTQTEPTYADGKVYIYVGMAYGSYQVWLSTENPAYIYYNGEFILYDKAQTLQNINTLKNSLETQIDSKVETWCQKTDPSTAWTTTELKNQHNGDLWYYTGESTSSYKNNTTYKYTASTNKWTAYSANPDLFDKIDGKTAIYYGTQSSVTSAEEGDYLVDSTDGSSYRWNNGAWVKVTDYKTTITNTIDAIEIGGRNLLLNTNNFNFHKYQNSTGGGTWSFNGDEATYTATTKSWAYLDLSYNPNMPSIDVSSQSNMDLMGNTNLTLSIEAKCEDECNGLFYFQPVIYGNNNNRKYFLVSSSAPAPNCVSAIKLTEEWERYVVTFPADYTNTKYWSSDSTQLSYPNTGFGARVYWNSTGTVHVRKPKLERGNKATDWIPAPEDTQADIDTALAQSVEYIVGTQTASTGTWTGVTTDIELKVGKTIAYKLPYAGNGNNVSLVLTLADGSTTDAIPVYLNTTRVTTHFGAGSVINMTYDGQYWRASSIPNSNTVGVYGGAFTAGTNGVRGYSLIMKDTQNTWVSITTSAGSNSTNAGNGTNHAKYTGGLYFDTVMYEGSNANYASGASIGTCYTALAIDLRYSTNCGSTLIKGRDVYLVGTITNGLFYLDNTWWTQTLPTSQNDKVYIYLGSAYSTTSIYLVENNPAYMYYEGKFLTLKEIETEKAKKTATNYMSSDNTGIMVADLANGEQLPANATGKNVFITAGYGSGDVAVNAGVHIRNGQEDLAFFGETAQIGKSDQGHIILDNDSVDVRNGDDILASFGETSIIGDQNQWHQTIASDKTSFANGQTEYAYISPDKFYAVNAEVSDAFYIGNYSIRNASDGKLVIGLRRK